MAAALEVFVNNLGTITIRRVEEPTTDGESLLEVHPDDVSMLMSALDEARRHARQLAADERHEDVTLPELLAHGRSGSA
jgi:hypothetical protein